MNYQVLIDRFRRARGDCALAVLEGFHPLKHAIRFGAELVETLTVDQVDLLRLAEKYAPDITPILGRRLKVIPEGAFRQLAPVPPPTGVIAIARRPVACPAEILDLPAPAPVVLLENPRNHHNIGAAVRAAAAAGAAGVITLGSHDPWNAASIISGVGSQFALPVARANSIPDCDRPLVAVDSTGEPLKSSSIPPRALLAFGAERAGLSPRLLASAGQCVAIPMREGISSLNLASAVAVVLYVWRLEHPETFP